MFSPLVKAGVLLGPAIGFGVGILGDFNLFFAILLSICLLCYCFFRQLLRFVGTGTALLKQCRYFLLAMRIFADRALGFR